MPEKILHATGETRKIINNNIGYADGIGAVMALKKKVRRMLFVYQGVSCGYILLNGLKMKNLFI